MLLLYMQESFQMPHMSRLIYNLYNPTKDTWWVPAGHFNTTWKPSVFSSVEQRTGKELWNVPGIRLKIWRWHIKSIYPVSCWWWNLLPPWSSAPSETNRWKHESLWTAVPNRRSSQTQSSLTAVFTKPFSSSRPEVFQSVQRSEYTWFFKPHY